MMVPEQERGRRSGEDRRRQARAAVNSNDALQHNGPGSGPRPPRGVQESYNREKQREAAHERIRNRQQGKGPEQALEDKEKIKAIYEKAMQIKKDREQQNQLELNNRAR
jgi:hypothetical protein